MHTKLLHNSTSPVKWLLQRDLPQSQSGKYALCTNSVLVPRRRDEEAGIYTPSFHLAVMSGIQSYAHKVTQLSLLRYAGLHAC